MRAVTTSLFHEPFNWTLPCVTNSLMYAALHDEIDTSITIGSAINFDPLIQIMIIEEILNNYISFFGWNQASYTSCKRRVHVTKKRKTMEDNMEDNIIIIINNFRNLNKYPSKSKWLNTANQISIYMHLDFIYVVWGYPVHLGKLRNCLTDSLKEYVL